MFAWYDFSYMLYVNILCISYASLTLQPICTFIILQLNLRCNSNFFLRKMFFIQYHQPNYVYFKYVCIMIWRYSINQHSTQCVMVILAKNVLQIQVNFYSLISMMCIKRVTFLVWRCKPIYLHYTPYFKKYFMAGWKHVRRHYIAFSRLYRIRPCIRWWALLKITVINCLICKTSLFLMMCFLPRYVRKLMSCKDWMSVSTVGHNNSSWTTYRTFHAQERHVHMETLICL
jgi:hypothetical protein